MTGNHVDHNLRDGISNGAEAEPITYEGNDVSNNGGYGIRARDAVTRFIDNTLRHNGSDGLNVSDGFGVFFPYWFSGNVADDNGGLGISFDGVPTRLPPGSPATVDGGGNAAKHNAGPEQCHIIVCAYNRGLAK